MKEYEQLRELILGEEQAAIREIETQLRLARTQLNDPEAIVERVAPLLASIVRRTAERDLEALRLAVIDLCERLSLEAPDGAYETLIGNLTPAIYRRLHREIETNREAVADLIYPVVGGMVAKYVTQSFKDLIDGINERVHSGLSMGYLRRKLISKIRGIPESQLLLLESTSYRIKAALLIHKEMGVVLGHRIADDATLRDPDMVAAMLTALTDFINSWIASEEISGNIHAVNYGDSKIVLEDSGRCYLAALVQGPAERTLLEVLRSTLTAIVERHGMAIRAFEGDMQTIPVVSIHEQLAPLFHIDTYQRETVSRTVWPFRIISALVLALLFWQGYLYIQKEGIESEVRHLIGQDPYLAFYRIEPIWRGETLVVKGSVPSEVLRSRIRTSLKKLGTHTHRIENGVRVVTMQPAVDEAAVRGVVDAFNEELYTSLQVSFEGNTVRLDGTVDSETRLRQLRRTLGAVAGVASLVSNVRIVAAEALHTLYFATESAQLEPLERAKLDRIADQLRLHKTRALALVGYTSLSGTVETNRALARSRAEAVQRALVELGVESGRIQMHWVAFPPLSDNRFTENAQCVKLYWYNGETRSEGS